VDHELVHRRSQELQDRISWHLVGIVASILKMATGRNCSMSRIKSGHHYLPTYQILMISENVEFLQYCCVFKIFEMSTIFKIQHCPISSKLDMWVDNDVPNWFPTLKNFYQMPFPNWPPQYCKNSTRCQESFRDFIIYPHMKCRWNRTMLNLCGIVVAILKMVIVT
jgi:hypothetical protein